MSKLNRFFASFLLIVSLSVVAFAGETQGPTICSDHTPPPVSHGRVGSTENSSTISDALKTAESVAIWLLTQLF